MNSIWLPLIVVGILTYVSRFSFIAFSQNIHIKPQVSHTLKYIPISVLAAIIVPEIFKSSNIQNFISEPRVLAGIIAIIVAARTKNVILTITIGMAVLYLFQILVIN